MNRLNTEVSVSAAAETPPANVAPPANLAPEASAYPLYVDNLIYLPFARHLAEDDLAAADSSEELHKAA
ncbi:hypothetical protein EON82_07770 [bacterium]|nr:MAG: hypothetical protein EON82_07770 [bacterium]